MIADCILRVKSVYPVSKPCIENGVVEIRDGKIAAVGNQRTHSANAIDLGEVAMIPELVNSHTHLEFSGLQHPLGSRSMAFTDWLRVVVARRAVDCERTNMKSLSIQAGIRESTAAGVIAIGEIASAPVDIDDYGDRIQITVFLERLGRDPERIARINAEGLDWLQLASTNRKIVRAISPHAPYSVHPGMLAESIGQSMRFGCPVAMHVAESREELQLLAGNNGPFVELLESLGAWFPDTYPRGSSVLDCLKQLCRAPRSLVVHGNYLVESEIGFIAEHAATMSIVYCPRTHDYFGHEPYPLEQFLAAGINVAVGTDSRASNPDLRLFEELKMVRKKFPQLDERHILEMGTLNGAIALGLDPTMAAIEPGGDASVNLVPLTPGKGLFHEEATCMTLASVLCN